MFIYKNKNIETLKELLQLKETENKTYEKYNVNNNNFYFDDEDFIIFKNTNDIADFCKMLFEKESTELFTTDNSIFVKPSIFDITDFIYRWIFIMTNNEPLVTNVPKIRIVGKVLFLFGYELELDIDSKYIDQAEIYRNIRVLLLSKEKLKIKERTLLMKELIDWDICQFIVEYLADSEHQFIHDFFEEIGLK